MYRADDSLNINTSNDFIFDLTKQKINPNPQSSIKNNQTFDDLEYSIDQPSYECILGQLGKQQPKVIPNISAPVTINRQQDKKKQRKAIFQKYKQKTEKKVDVMNMFYDVLKGKAQNTVTTNTTNQEQKYSAATSNQQQQGQLISYNQGQANKMNPPPNLIKKNSFQSPKGNNDPAISSIQNRNSNISMAGSFSLYDGFSAIMGGGGNNNFGHSRQSQQIADLLDAEIFGSFRHDERSSIQVQINENNNQNMNILDDIKMSAIGNKQLKNQDIQMLNDINLAESQDHDIKKIKQIQKEKETFDSPNIKFQPLPIKFQEPPKNIPQSQQPKIGFQIQSNNKVQNQTQLTLNGQVPNRQNTSIPFTSPEPSNLNSQLSLYSNFVKVNNNSSHLLSSNSLTKALGNLSQHIFLEATVENRMPQLLKQSWRLNSTSINIHSLTLSLDALRHKEIIRSLIFQLFMASQTLQKFRQELQIRQNKQKLLYTSFNLTLFLEGDWYQSAKIKNNQIIKPKQPHPKRPTDFNKIKETLKNSVEVLKYFQNFVDKFKIQPTDEFKKKYVELKNSLFEIFSNLKKISQDLYMKSINMSLPRHYYSFYEYIKNPQYISRDYNSIEELNKKIDERENILLQIEYFKNQHDPLASSSLSKDIQRKAKNQLLVLKAAYYNNKKKSSKK